MPRSETAWRTSVLVLITLVMTACVGMSLVLSSSQGRLVRGRVFDVVTQQSSYWGRPREVENGEVPRLTVVETLPVGNMSLPSALPQTAAVLLDLTRGAKESIDISAMYWNLLGLEDRKMFTSEQMKVFGADRGEKLFAALVDAVKRGVQLRIVTAKDQLQGENKAAKASLPEELKSLVASAPEHVHVQMWSGPEWYGGGILHQKLWIFDGQHAYIGSANMDWKSLAQVMEVGIVMTNFVQGAGLMEDLQRLFNVWWQWSASDFVNEHPARPYYSSKYQANLIAPPWSQSLPMQDREPDPFATANLAALGNVSHQLKIPAASPRGSAQMFVASAPMESTVQQTRTFDEDALVYTIRSAQTNVNISVMDFVPFSLYSLTSHRAPIYWPALTDAILAGVYAKPHVRVRLLISEWAHSRKEMFAALRNLRDQAALCHSLRASKCTGRLDIKIFRVPGWQNTTGTARHEPAWPTFTRVNHAKYIVSDKRVNIGTSNMEWGYFYTTAGISVNTDDETTRKHMEDHFSRNWDSVYATDL